MIKYIVILYSIIINYNIKIINIIQNNTKYINVKINRIMLLSIFLKSDLTFYNLLFCHHIILYYLYKLLYLFLIVCPI